MLFHAVSSTKLPSAGAAVAAGASVAGAAVAVAAGAAVACVSPAGVAVAVAAVLLLLLEQPAITTNRTTIKPNNDFFKKFTPLN